MTPTAGRVRRSVGPPDDGEGGFHPDPQPNRAAPTWPRVAGLVAVILLCFFVVRSCQNSGIKVSEEEAVELARPEVDFTPTYTQVRFLRQGLRREPYWFVSFSIPIGSKSNPEGYEALAVIKVNGEDGAVEVVEEGNAAVEADEQAAEDAEEKPEPEE